MLPFNEEFQTGESKITQVRLEVLLNNGTLLSLTEEHVMLGGLTRDSSTTVDGQFTVGAAVTGKLSVIIDNSDQSLSEYDFRAAVITASLGGQLSDGNYELIQIGIYTVDEYTYDGTNITLTAYDNFHKFDLPCSESSVTFPRTITQLITQACSLAGVTLANTSIPNGSYSVTKQPESWDTMTWHDVVSYCAQIGCCFAKILSNGKLFFAWYETNSLPGDQYDGGVFDGDMPSLGWLAQYMNTDDGMVYLRSDYLDDGWVRVNNSIEFVFNDAVYSQLYISSNSSYAFRNTWPGYETTTNDINIYTRNGSANLIKYQVIDNDGAKAIKVRYHGYTRSSKSYMTREYELEYEIFFVSTGGIVVNPIKLPTNSSYFGTTSIIENSVSSAFTLTTGEPAVLRRDGEGHWIPGDIFGRYITGATLDGGDFDYTETVSVDGGTFGDREDVTIIGSTFDLAVDTDDVMITGVSVLLAVANNINAADGTQDYENTLGTAGYVIRIENNPLIETTANADAVCAYLYDYLVGMRFRPLSASIPENPALEAGDVALVVDRYNNTYTSFLSHVTYTTNSSTQFSCDAESTMQNLKARYSEAQKTRAMAQRVFDKAITDAESAMSTIMTALATTMGLYQYTQSDGQGGTIYVYGNKNTLAASNIRWKFSAGAMMVSSDYGQTWNGAITADGIAVLQAIYAVKVNADNILTGNISIGGTSGNKDGTLLIKDANGNTIVQMNKNGVTVNGGTINGPTLNIGGSGTAGSLKIKDANGNTIVSMDKTGASFKGSVQSGSSVSGATVSGGTINGSAISVGGQNNTSGSLEVKNNSNVRICRIDNGGIYFGNIANSLSSPNAKIDNNGTFYSTGTYSIAKYTDGGLILQRAPSGSNCLYVEAYGYTTSGLSCRVYNANGTLSIGGSAGTRINGYLIAGDPKARMINTKNYSNRLLFCYETPTPYFGDIGTGKTDENGEAIIDLDDIFVETIDRHIEYNIFLQKEGRGDIWVEEKECTHFVVKGTPNLKFSWEIKAVQIDAANMRLVDNDIRESGTYIDDDIGLNMVSDLEMLDQEVLFEEVI